jgi:hypothetical protein
MWLKISMWLSSIDSANSASGAGAPMDWSFTLFLVLGLEIIIHLILHTVDTVHTVHTVQY